MSLGSAFLYPGSISRQVLPKLWPDGYQQILPTLRRPDSKAKTLSDTHWLSLARALVPEPFAIDGGAGWGSDGSLMEPEGRVNSIHATGPTGGLILKGQLACTCGSKLGMDIGQAKQ